MVTTLKASAVGKTVFCSRGWITPLPVVDEERVGKGAYQSLPILRHTIHNMEQEVEVESDAKLDVDVDGIAYGLIQDYNILVPQLSFLKFISNNSTADTATVNLGRGRFWSTK
jgi:hypothetical protein